jgi:hypothetical protein
MFGGLGYLNKLGASGGLVFSPGQLFSGGEQGAWYDPSDNLTMYGTAGGESPITAVEQAVGLILDKSKGLAIGSDTLSGVWLNAFSTTFDTFTSTSSGGFTATTTGAKSPRTRCVGSVSPGFWYQVTFTVETLTNASLSIFLTDNAYSGNSVASSGTISAVGTYTRILGSASTTTVTGLMAIVTATGASTVTISGITVRLLAGNHAYQTTSASRPTLRARYNLLTYSEEFDNAAWSILNAAIIKDSTVAPDGTTTADTFNVTDASNVAKRTNQILSPTPSGVTAFSVYVKAGTQNFVQLLCTGDVQAFANFDVSAGTVGTAGTKTTASIQNVGSGWYRCVVVFDATTVYTGATFRIQMVTSASAIWGATTPNTGTFFLWGAQLVPTAVFPSNVYQRIAAATVYDTGAAFPQYLAFDGTDDSLLTASVDFATVTSDGAARRNLLLNPTQFDAAGWTLTQSTVTANATTAPDGTTTADKFIANINNDVHWVQQSVTLSSSIYTLSFYAKAAGYGIIQALNSSSATDFVNFDLTNGVIGTNSGYTGSIVAVGDGWYRCIVLLGLTSGTAAWARFGIVPAANSARGATFAGDGTSGVFIWGAQLETGSTATAFQNIGTDKMTVFSGVSKLSDAAAGIVVELSAVLTSNNGSFFIIAPTGAAGNNYQYASRGTSTASASGTYVSPITNVVTGQSDIGAPSISLRVNAAVAASNTSTQGTGNFGSYPLYIGRRNNATLPLNGRIYSLIIRGAASNSTQVAQTERYVAAKTPLGVVP